MILRSDMKTMDAIDPRLGKLIFVQSLAREMDSAILSGIVVATFDLKSGVCHDITKFFPSIAEQNTSERLIDMEGISPLLTGKVRTPWLLAHEKNEAEQSWDEVGIEIVNSMFAPGLADSYVFWYFDAMYTFKQLKDFLEQVVEEFKFPVDAERYDVESYLHERVLPVKNKEDVWKICSDLSEIRQLVLEADLEKNPLVTDIPGPNLNQGSALGSEE